MAKVPSQNGQEMFPIASNRQAVHSVRAAIHGRVATAANTRGNPIQDIKRVFLREATGGVWRWRKAMGTQNRARAPYGGRGPGDTLVEEGQLFLTVVRPLNQFTA